MSKIDDGVLTDRLPLPSPRSSDELDERILGAARDRAPASRPQRQPWWIAGATTASVLVIAVTMTWTEPTPTHSIEESVAASPVTARMSAKKMKGERRELHKMGASTQMPDQAVAQTEAARVRIGSDSLAEDTLSGYALAPAVRAPESEARKPTQTAAELSSPITPVVLSQKIQILADLVGRGEQEKAQADYDSLKKSCPDCDLPERLEQAIAKYTGVE